MNFFGLMNFQAPYLPWVLCGFSILLGGSTTVDIIGIYRFYIPSNICLISITSVSLIGIIVGHTYYYLEDVFPNQPGGFRILKTPRIM